MNWQANDGRGEVTWRIKINVIVNWYSQINYLYCLYRKWRSKISKKSSLLPLPSSMVFKGKTIAPIFLWPIEGNIKSTVGPIVKAHHKIGNICPPYLCIGCSMKQNVNEKSITQVIHPIGFQRYKCFLIALSKDQCMLHSAA